MIYLKDYILNDKVLFIDSQNKEEVLKTLVNSVQSLKSIKNFDSFNHSVFDRESILSTGIGNNVAIPHVKMNEIDDFFIAIGVHKQGLNWDSIDNKPVHLIFLIGGPNDHNLYLRILSKLFLIVKNKKIRDQILNSDDPEQIIQLFNNF